MSNRNSGKTAALLEEAIGGQWQHSRKTSVQPEGFTANFPKFRSDAIVGVVNAAAEQAGANGRAVAIGSGAGSSLLGQMPNAPRDVVIPRELAEHKGFQEQLAAGMKQVITEAISRQLSYQAGQGLHAR